jgi:hypothetical protein
VYIERLIDYLLGDTDRDGYVETAQGEVFDYDGDGTPPYDPATGAFDEDDWGDLDEYEDDFHRINSGYPGDSYVLYDHNLDNHVDIDLDPDLENLEVDGTDLDNQGLFDGIDVNQDGDMDDWVSIDEAIVLWGDDLYDDELAALLDRVDANVISVFMEPCFSGGFIDDLSGPDRVISTATEEETVSWGNLFVELFTEAFHRATRSGSPVDADADGNGHISMREAFNYAAENDTYAETPQYDDNGDGIGHPFPIPQGGDGDLGAVTYLESFYGVMASPIADARSGDPGEAITYTLSVTNSGTYSDTFDVGLSGHAWPTGAPSTLGSLAANESTNVDVTVSIPAGTMGGTTDAATVVVVSRGDGTRSATATLTTTANSFYGLTVSPATDARSGDPGEAILYTLRVTNTGNTTDTYGIAIGSTTWETSAPNMAGPLATGECVAIDVVVNISAGAAGGASDTTSVTVTSQSDGTCSAMATLTTTANSVYGVTVHPATYAQSGDPGETITCTLQVTNTGNTADTFAVSFSGYVWPTNAPSTVGPLVAGERAAMDVLVNVPSDAVDGATDTATIVVTSQGDGAKQVTVTLITEAGSPSYDLYLPLILR